MNPFPQEQPIDVSIAACMSVINDWSLDGFYLNNRRLFRETGFIHFIVSPLFQRWQKYQPQKYSPLDLHSDIGP
jgi:hypothetical protein